MSAVSCTAEEPSLDSSSAALEGFNGENLNGENLNGENLNGENLNGENLNGGRTHQFTVWTSLEGVRIGPDLIENVTLTASQFRGTRDGSPIWGNAFVGAEFQAMRGDDVPVTLRVVSATLSRGIWKYGVRYRETDGQWYSICHDASGPLPAIALNGVWNHHFGAAGGGSHEDHATRFTFACSKIGTLAKCAEDGYTPWTSPLYARLHQACTRMLRADYCGDGRSFTTNGRLVNLYDAFGIQNDTNDYRIEAEWDENGARCLTQARRAPDGYEISCVDPALEESCGSLSHFDSGTLIINEIP